MKTTVVAITQPLVNHSPQLTPEAFIVYCARVSSPQNQLNAETAPRLIAYCIRNRHWSIFEQVDMTVEIETSRAIAAQILRHRSFSFQEFSLRYAKASDREEIEWRMKGSTNRQGSTDEVADPMTATIGNDALDLAFETYNELVNRGVSLESARMVLPLCTRTRIYMKGSIRSWIHYFAVRCDGHAQKEHRLVAESIRVHFETHFPNIAAAIREQVA